MTKSTGTTKIYMSCTEDTALRTNYGCLLQLLGGIKCGYSLPEVDILPQKYLSFFFFLMEYGSSLTDWTAPEEQIEPMAARHQ